jgi:hypothetical protein
VVLATGAEEAAVVVLATGAEVLVFVFFEGIVLCNGVSYLNPFHNIYQHTRTHPCVVHKYYMLYVSNCILYDLKR